MIEFFMTIGICAVIGIVCGGLVGAILSLWINRNQVVHKMEGKGLE